MSQQEHDQSTEYCLNYHKYVPYNSTLIVLVQETGYVDIHLTRTFMFSKSFNTISLLYKLIKIIH